MDTTLDAQHRASTARAVGAGLIVAALLIGLPLILINTTGAPWTWDPDWMRVRNTLTHWPWPQTAIPYLIAVLGWAAWAAIAVAIGRDAVLVATGRATERPAITPLRILTATLLGSVAATAPAWTASAEAPAATETCPVPGEPAPADAAEADPEPEPVADAVVTVDRHDPDRATLWGMAEDHYGTGTEYKRIFNANKGITQSDGSILTDEDHIVDGTAITIPGTAPDPDSEPEPEPEPETEPEPELEPQPEEDQLDETSGSDGTAAEPAAPQTETSPPAFANGAWLLGGGAFLAIGTIAAITARRRRRTAPQPEPRSPQPKRQDPAPAAPDETTAPDDDTPFTGRLLDLEAALERHQAREHDDTTAPLATGTGDAENVSVLDHAHSGIGITGPGAHAVVRAALASALVSGAAVVTDTATVARLGLRLPEPLDGLDVADLDDLADTAVRTRARVRFDPDQDTLTEQYNVIVTDSATAEALPAHVLDHEATYAVLLGPWGPAWIEAAADGTPTAGRLLDGPAADLGQCYLMDTATTNDLLTELAATEPAPPAAPDPEPDTETDTGSAEPETEPEPASGSAPTAPPAAPAATGADDADEVLDLGKGPRFELSLFGEHRLTWNGDPVRFRRAYCLDIIAVLALTDWHLDGMGIAMIIDPDMSMRRAGDRRTSAISEARHVLRTLTGIPNLSVFTFKRRDSTYWLNPALFHTDLDAFDTALDAAASAPTPGAEIEHLETAMRLYAGPLGAELDEQWDLIDQRRHWQTRAYDTALRLAELHRAGGREAQAAAVLERAAAIDPDRPEAWEHLGAHHREHGDPTRADEADARARHRREAARLAAHRTDTRGRT